MFKSYLCPLWGNNSLSPSTCWLCPDIDSITNWVSVLSSHWLSLSSHSFCVSCQSLRAGPLPLSPGLLWTCQPPSLFTEAPAPVSPSFHPLCISEMFIKGKSNHIIPLFQILKFVTLWCGFYLPLQNSPLTMSPAHPAFLAATRKDFHSVIKSKVAPIFLPNSILISWHSPSKDSKHFEDLECTIHSPIPVPLCLPLPLLETPFFPSQCPRKTLVSSPPSLATLLQPLQPWLL